MTSDQAAIAQAIALRRAEVEAPTRLLELLCAAKAENAELREQLDAAIRRVALRCAGPRCEGRGVYYPADGERTCIACSDRSAC